MNQNILLKWEVTSDCQLGESMPLSATPVQMAAQQLACPASGQGGACVTSAMQGLQDHSWPPGGTETGLAFGVETIAFPGF